MTVFDRYGKHCHGMFRTFWRIYFFLGGGGGADIGHTCQSAAYPPGRNRVFSIRRLHVSDILDQSSVLDTPWNRLEPPRRHLAPASPFPLSPLPQLFTHFPMRAYCGSFPNSSNCVCRGGRRPREWSNRTASSIGDVWRYKDGEKVADLSTGRVCGFVLWLALRVNVDQNR